MGRPAVPVVISGVCAHTDTHAHTHTRTRTASSLSSSSMQPTPAKKYNKVTWHTRVCIKTSKHTNMKEKNRDLEGHSNVREKRMQPTVCVVSRSNSDQVTRCTSDQPDDEYRVLSTWTSSEGRNNEERCARAKKKYTQTTQKRKEKRKTRRRKRRRRRDEK